MRWRSGLALLLFALAVAVAGCGGDEGSEKTFDDPSFDLTFKYPAEFELSDDVSASIQVGGAASGKSKGLRLDENNGIVIQSYELNAGVTEANLEDVKPQLDRLLAQGVGETVSGRRITAGGLPGYEYEFDVPRPAGTRSRLAVLFDARSQHTVNCQYTESKRREVADACERALDTLEAK